MKKKIVIIGSGFSSLSAASYIAKEGFEVHVFEKNKTLGGRARQLKKNGFTFDMGPSWYWMPEIFESFYNEFGKTTSDLYKLERLDPGYQVVFGENESIHIGDSLEKIYDVFEKEESGSSYKLKRFMSSSKENYEIAVTDMLDKMPGISPLELVTPQTIRKIKYFLSNIKKDVYKQFKSPKLRQILQFPALFLGAKPSNTPSFFNFMNWVDFGLGTWHPKGGMYRVVEGMISIAKSLSVVFHTDAAVEKIQVDASGKAEGIIVNGEFIGADVVLSGADYHHTETLLDQNYRAYSEAYWDKKVFAPSSLLFYIGLDKKVDNLCHHNLFFDVDFDKHAEAIYDNPKWPENPLFYANLPSVSDSSMAPEGKEACFLLIPIAPGIEDTPMLRTHYYDLVMNRLEKLTGQKLKKHVEFTESFCVNDFVEDYNSYKGNAYGLANTLLQTAFLRPKLKSKKVKSLFFTGQLTVPGPGVPPALISGKLVAKLIAKKI